MVSLSPWLEFCREFCRTETLALEIYLSRLLDLATRSDGDWSCKSSCLRFCAAMGVSNGGGLGAGVDFALASECEDSTFAVKVSLGVMRY